MVQKLKEEFRNDTGLKWHEHPHAYLTYVQCRVQEDTAAELRKLTEKIEHLISASR